MAGGSTGFVLTPHKVSMCILLQAYALPAAASPPLCPLPTPVRQRLALFLLHLCKASDNFVEPSLVELSVQLKDVLEEAGDMLVDQLASRLLAFSSPEELFSFILGLRDLLAPVLNVASEVGNGEDEPCLVEPNSSLGQFLRRCILSFNLLSFEGTCRILNDLDAYRQPMLNITGGEPLVENLLSKKVEDMDIPDEDDRDEDDEYLDDENLESESSLMDRQKSGLDAEATGRKAYDNSCRVLGCSSLSSEGGSPITGAGFQGSVQDGGFSFAFGDTPSRVEASNEGVFLRTFGQVEAYMKEQADLIEKQAGIFPMQELDTKLNQLEKLAPDLHRVHYLRYLNCLSNGDFPAAMDNLHRYFDYSAGKGGINNNGVSSDASVGRFQAGLLTLGSMHAHFGHVTQALQILRAFGSAKSCIDYTQIKLLT